MSNRPPVYVVFASVRHVMASECKGRDTVDLQLEFVSGSATHLSLEVPAGSFSLGEKVRITIEKVVPDAKT